MNKQRNILAVFAVASFTLLFIYCNSVMAEDWPTFRHDNHRSGITGI